MKGTNVVPMFSCHGIHGRNQHGLTLGIIAVLDPYHEIVNQAADNMDRM